MDCIYLHSFAFECKICIHSFPVLLLNFHKCPTFNAKSSRKLLGKLEDLLTLYDVIIHAEYCIYGISKAYIYVFSFECVIHLNLEFTRVIFSTFLHFANIACVNLYNDTKTRFAFILFQYFS